MTILYDVTALLLRMRNPVMTGIDRVDFSLAFTLAERSLCGLRPAHFLIKTRYASGVLDARQMMSLLHKMRVKRGIIQRPTALLDSVLAVLAQPPCPRDQPGVLRLGANQRNNGVWWSKLETAARVVTQTQSLMRFIASTEYSFHYIHASHYGFRHLDRFNWLERYNIQSTFFIHDLIPIDYPQFCSCGAKSSLKYGVEIAAQTASKIAVNSESTESRLRNYLREEGLRQPLIEIHRLGAGALPGCDPFILDHNRTPMLPFFVCPGTIEGRKNVRVLLDAWRLMSAQRAVADMPRLVLAGQRGWNNAELLHDLDTMTDIAPFIVEVPGLNDTELASLYRLSSAVLVPSWVEGFSLTVAEALMHDTRVIASDIGAHREIARAKGELVDAGDASAWLNAIVNCYNLEKSSFNRRWSDFSKKLADKTPY